jgi:drug/metabolite transporter (DMT)-like permease
MFGAVHTSGSMSALLCNAVIPLTMFFSALFLRTKYSKHQYLGALIILMGIGVVLLPKYYPSIIGQSSSTTNDNNSTFFNLLFLSSLIPLALSSIYKEVAFGEADIDVNYLQAFVAGFQFCIGCCLIPLQTLPLFGNDVLR